jgi:hypothetical protein
MLSKMRRPSSTAARDDEQDEERHQSSVMLARQETDRIGKGGREHQDQYEEIGELLQKQAERRYLLSALYLVTAEA